MNAPLLTQSIEQLNLVESVHALETGSILFFPQHYFTLEEPELMKESILDGKHKNISYDYKKNKLSAFKKDQAGLEEKLTLCLRNYAEFALQLIQTSLPQYVPHLQWGRTSYRPAQIQDRALSKRKDDRRLHVDSFASSPVHGLRILRVFCNINPYAEPRVWHLGEPFPKVLERFAPKVSPYSRFKARVLKRVKATKTLRSPYDHYMLQLHDRMKLDDRYQAEVKKTKVDFPAQSTWIVFTDQVSHAALSGQYLLEQTFYLPVDQMANSELSPWFAWQKLKG